MTMTKPQTLDTVEAVEEAITRNVDEDGSIEEYEALLDRRSRLEREAGKPSETDTAQKNVKDLLELAEEARLRAEAAKEAPQATAEEKFYLELTARTAEVEALELAAAAPFAEDTDDELAVKLLEAASSHEELREAAKAARPGTAKAELANREAERAGLAWAAVDAERLRRKTQADVERGFELNAHRDTLERLRVEDTKALAAIRKSTHFSPADQEHAEKIFAERYATTVNSPGDPSRAWTGSPERYQKIRSEVEEKLREQMEAAKRDFVMAGRGQPRRR